MSARHVTALRRALRQCCGGQATRSVLVRTDRGGQLDFDAASVVRVCAGDLGRLLTELRAADDIDAAYELSSPWAPDDARCGAVELVDGESIAAPDDDRARLVAGLRQLADWYETTAAPMPRFPRFGHCASGKDGDDAGRAMVAEVAAALGVEHDATVYRPETSRKFAGLTFEAFYVPRQDAADWSAKQEAAAELVSAGWKPGDPVPSLAEDPMASGRDVDAEVTGKPLPPGVEGIPVSSPPHNTGRPIIEPAAEAEAVSPLELASPAPVAGREGCDGCGKVGRMSPHRPGCPVRAAWDKHEAGDHSACRYGGALCVPPPVEPASDPMHVGRAFAGNRIERTCGCRLAACGLVDTTGTDPGCPHHPVERGEMMRQMHRASQCPALRGPR